MRRGQETRDMLLWTEKHSVSGRLILLRSGHESRNHDRDFHESRLLPLLSQSFTKRRRLEVRLPRKDSHHRRRTCSGTQAVIPG